MHKIITLDNKHCQFLTEDLAIFNKLKTFLSFRIAGVEYMPAYQNGWSGITYLINKKGIFNSGLLCKVKMFLTDKSIAFEEEDRRKKIIANKEIDISDKLKSLGMIPHDHQNRILESALASNKGIIRSCTGSGKTLAAALITAKLNKPTTIYVIGLDLLKQFHDLFSLLFDEPIGYIGNGVCKIERINIATIWTIGRALKIDKKKILSDDEEEDEKSVSESQYERISELLKSTKVHMFDESHVVATSTISEIYKYIDPEYIYGFSGTPFRGDNTDLLVNGILGEQIINISASELIDKKLLAQPIIKFITVPRMNMHDAAYQTAYKDYIVENDIRNNLIVESTKELVDKKYTVLVLFKQIKHGQILLDMMQDNNIKCEMLYGEDNLDRRTEVKEMLEKNEINVILASTIFDLGIDIPKLSGLVLCGSGKSSIRALQRIGRVIRRYPGKTMVAVVDFYDQAKFLKKHSMDRCNVYKSENGFKIIQSREMKK